MAHGVRFTFIFFLWCSLIGLAEGRGRLDRTRERRYGKSSKSSKSKSGSHSSSPYFSFFAMGTGEQEVLGEPVETDTTAKAYLWFDAGFTSLEYRVDVFDGSDITLLHFHCGVAGVNGPVIVEPFSEPDGEDSDGTLDEGYITNEDIEKDTVFVNDTDCGITINNIASIYEAVVQRSVYLNVHSVANPKGVVRGQFVKK